MYKFILHKFIRQRLLPVVALGLPASSALAHPGSESVMSFSQGLWHPGSGLDHLLALLAVGMLAMGAARFDWRIPLLFLLAMLAGVGLGLQGLAMPGLEPGIAMSVLLFGLLLLAGRKIHGLLQLSLIAGFALLHGMAHGLEMSAGPAATSYILGLTAGSVLWLAAGAGLARLVQRSTTRGFVLAGMTFSGAGLVLLAGL